MTGEAIGPAGAGDLEAIAAIYAHYVRTSTATWRTEVPDTAEWADILTACEAAGHPFLVLQIGGTVVGFAYLAPFRGMMGWKHTLEDTIYLREDAVGGGRGGRLLAALLAAADPDRVREVVAMISGEVPASIALHARLGFQEIGRMPGVGTKFGRRLDCVVMQRTLVPGQLPAIVD